MVTSFEKKTHPTRMSRKNIVAEDRPKIFYFGYFHNRDLNRFFDASHFLLIRP
jgi:hypothetical protein